MTTRPHHFFRCSSALALLATLLSTPAYTRARESQLLKGLLLIESEDSALCREQLDQAGVRRRIDELAAAARNEVQTAGTPTESAERARSVVTALNRIVFGQAGIRPSQDLHDPCNVFLSSVLARKQGYCVGIASLYLVIAEQLDLPVRAVSTPTHVFLRYDDGVTRINIETANAGGPLSDEQYVSQHQIAQTSIKKGVFLRALSASQFLAQVHNNLGVIYSERRDYTRADAEYSAALRLDKHLPAAWYNRGKNLIEQGDLEGAIRSFTRALRLNPNDTWALNNQGLAYKQLGKTEKARADFEAALQIDPAFEQARANLAVEPAIRDR